MGTNLRQKQTAALNRMLNFNVPLADSEGGVINPSEWSDHWKVLIYDRKCRDIISPLLNVSKLRKRGVTLHLLLEAEREDIPDVPAVYFVDASEENIQRIADDASKRLYSQVYLNFVSRLDRPLMEKLARSTIASNAYSMVTKVFDQYLDFVTLEPRLFTLNQPNSYLGYNNPGATQADIEAYVSQVTYGLFSVLATVGTVPVIRCAPGGPAEMVARRLNELVSEHILGGSTPFFSRSTAAAFHRPLLVLFDRNDDLITALHHTSTYQALIDDVLPHKLNRVTIEAEGGGQGQGQGQGQRRTYDLDVEADGFYAKYAGALFPEAIQANGAELAEVSKKEEEIRSKTMSQLGGGAAAQEDPMQDGSAKELLSAVDSLPKLLERKKGLEAHTNVLQAIMNVIAAREVPVLFDLEESLVTTSGRGADKAALKALLADPAKGSLHDKLRLLAVYTLSSKATPAEMQELGEAVRQAFANGPPPPGSQPHGSGAGGAPRPATAASAWPSPEEVELGIGAVEYLRRQRAAQHLPDRQELEAQAAAAAAAKAGGGAGAGGGGAGGGLADRGYMSQFINKAQSQATGLLAKASNLLARRNSLYVTRVVDHLCAFKPGSEDETFLYLDPKIKGVDPSTVKGRAPFREVFVFVIGGGCYAEHQNLQEYARSQPPTAPRQVLYGCTELLNAEGFLAQLAELGRRTRK